MWHNLYVNDLKSKKIDLWYSLSILYVYIFYLTLILVFL